MDLKNTASRMLHEGALGVLDSLGSGCLVSISGHMA